MSLNSMINTCWDGAGLSYLDCHSSSSSVAPLYIIFVRGKGGVRKMLKFIFGMIIPLCIFIYTISFGRWMHQKRQIGGAVSAYILACIGIAVSGAVLWRLLV